MYQRSSRYSFWYAGYCKIVAVAFLIMLMEEIVKSYFKSSTFWSFFNFSWTSLNCNKCFVKRLKPFAKLFSTHFDYFVTKTKLLKVVNPFFVNEKCLKTDYDFFTLLLKFIQKRPALFRPGRLTENLRTNFETVLKKVSIHDIRMHSTDPFFLLI